MAKKSISSKAEDRQEVIPEAAIKEACHRVDYIIEKEFLFEDILRDFKSYVSACAHWKKKLKDPTNHKTGRPLKSSTLKAYESNMNSSRIMYLAWKLIIQVLVYNDFDRICNKSSKGGLKKYFLKQALETTNYYFSIQYFLNKVVDKMMILDGKGYKRKPINPLTDSTYANAERYEGGNKNREQLRQRVENEQLLEKSIIGAGEIREMYAKMGDYESIARMNEIIKGEQKVLRSMRNARLKVLK